MSLIEDKEFDMETRKSYKINKLVSWRGCSIENLTFHYSSKRAGYQTNCSYGRLCISRKKIRQHLAKAFNLINLLKSLEPDLLSEFDLETSILSSFDFSTDTFFTKSRSANRKIVTSI